MSHAILLYDNIRKYRLVLNDTEWRILNMLLCNNMNVKDSIDKFSHNENCSETNYHVIDSITDNLNELNFKYLGYI